MRIPLSTNPASLLEYEPNKERKGSGILYFDGCVLGRLDGVDEAYIQRLYTEDVNHRARVRKELAKVG